MVILNYGTVPKLTALKVLDQELNERLNPEELQLIERIKDYMLSNTDTLPDFTLFTPSQNPSI